MNYAHKHHWRSIAILMALANLVYATPIYAAAQTDTQIRNYSATDLSIEYKKVDLKGNISWIPIGNVSSKRSRMFRNVTIGSVLRAVKNNQVVEEFTVDAPQADNKFTIVSIGK